MPARRPLTPMFEIAFVAALVLAASASPVSGSATYSTKLFMSEKFPAFHGKLHSSNDFCVADRPVKVYRERSGPDKLLGTDRSGKDGSWKVKVNLIGGAYYAKAALYGSASLGIECRPARSQVAVVD